MRKRKLQFAPDREIRHIDYGLDETVHTLKAYLRGRLLITHEETHGTGRRPKKPKYSETDNLIFSCALIGRRIIRKYARGETPNINRLKLWDKLLETIVKLEDNDVLVKAKIEKWKHKDLVFKCKIYEHKDYTIVIPQQPPKKKMPFQRIWHNPLMEQQLPSHISEKKSSAMISQHHNSQSM